MQLTITIECDNDAFRPDPSLELAQVLRWYAGALEGFRGLRTMVSFDETIPDSNGNTCGKVVWTS